jgi:hypothetical protein
MSDAFLLRWRVLLADQRGPGTQHRPPDTSRPPNEWNKGPISWDLGRSR